MQELGEPIWEGFLWSADRFADRPAIIADGETLSYRELREIACHIAATLRSFLIEDGILPGLFSDADPPLTAVLAYRTPAAFAGVLGALLAGHGYVPLNPHFPLERTRTMLEQSGCRVIVADYESIKIITEVVTTWPDSFPHPLLIIMPIKHPDGKMWAHFGIFKDHKLIDLSRASRPIWQAPTVSPDDTAYLLFTSGSTGVPKGVTISHRNVKSFVNFAVDRYQITEHDILSQMFDLTFDLSVFDMFVAWECGACVCCPSYKTTLNPGKFIQDNQLTIWFCVPSTLEMMQKLGSLKPDRFPSLRLSLFCGEALPLGAAVAWSKSAPNSVLENLYGPTELTVACTYFRWNGLPEHAELGLVPIGYPFPGMKVLVVDEDLKEVAPGETGELLMNGPQMSLGYRRDPEKTANAFVIPPGRQEVYYRTGDRVRRPVGDAPLTYLGRTGSQIKVLGHRVELGEIEAVIRDVSDFQTVVAVGWPVTASGFGGIEVFVEGDDEPQGFRSKIAGRLPLFMLPKQYHFWRRLPRNVNGKLDRKAMQESLRR